MQKFNGMQYLAIDIANHAGLDKSSWGERIQWVKDNFDRLEDLVPKDPKTKYLYIKAVKTLRSSAPTGFIMALDSTNSGVQIMAALGKCAKSAATCNLINTGKREDLYGAILAKTDGKCTRQEVKDAIVPMLYGSKAAPKELFGEGTPELAAFLQAVEETVPILGDMRALAKMVWNPRAEYHQFTLPDGHVVVLPSMVLKHIRVEALGTSFTYQWKDVEASENSTSLLANIIHAVDGYVSREMVRRCPFQLAHIHDSYWAHPNHMNTVRQVYKDILIEIAKSNLLEDILSEIKGETVTLEFTDPDLWKKMAKAEYMLS